MKYVYVLVSSLKDFYYEQCLMSVFSLRHYMKDAEVLILTDDKTTATFEAGRKGLLEYANIITVPFSRNATNVERSRILKTSIPDYIEGDFLFIDCDTIICGSLEEIAKYKMPIAAVLDGHVPLAEHKMKNNFVVREKRLGFFGTVKSGFHVNSGVILFCDTDISRQFFKKWNELWKYSFYRKHDHHDQSAFNQAVYEMQLKDIFLPGEWNCQVSQGGLACLEHAKIIHYFSSELFGKNYVPYYKLAQKDLLQKIKDTGSIGEDIQKMILNPRFQFNKAHLINDSRIVAVLQSPLLFTLADMNQKMPVVFRALESFVGGIRSIMKCVLKFR